MANRTIPVDIPEDLYLDCLVAVRIEPSEEHPVIAVLRRALVRAGLDGGAAIGLDNIAEIRQQELADEAWEALEEEEFEEAQREEEDLRALNRLESQYGGRNGGVGWGALFLPNTTRVRMIYKGMPHEAVVAHDALRWQDKPYSPSEFAAAVAGGTVRNPWRDLEIWCYPDKAWVRAAVLRKDKNAKRRLMHILDRPGSQLFRPSVTAGSAFHELSKRPESSADEGKSE